MSVTSLPTIGDKPLPMRSGASVQAIVPQTLEDVVRISKYIWESGLAPNSVRNQHAVTVILLKGLELGIKPMAALEGIAVINNKATINGALALALVRASGLLESMVEECDGKVAICTVRRKGESFDMTGEFSQQDAEAAGLWGKNTWKAYPKRMLTHRARGFALRDAFGDVLGGLVLTEEMEGGERQPDYPKAPFVGEEPINPDAEEVSTTPSASGGKPDYSSDPAAYKVWVAQRFTETTSLEEAEDFWNAEIDPISPDMWEQDLEDITEYWKATERRFKDAEL